MWNEGAAAVAAVVAVHVFVGTLAHGQIAFRVTDAFYMK